LLNRTAKQALVRIGLPVFLALMARAGFAQDASQPYYSIKRPHILVMTSGNAGDADIARQALSYAVTSVNFPTTFIDDSKLVDRQTLSQFDVFVQFGPARMTPEQEKALSDFVNNGGGFLALHDAIDGPRGGPYEKLLGGSLVRHSGPYHIEIHVTDEGRKNPLTAGMRDFEILEEQVFPTYNVDTPAPGGPPPAQPGAPQGGAGLAVTPASPVRAVPRSGPAHALITGFAMDNTVDPERLKLRTNVITNPIAGWWQEVGKGRMVYLSIGSTTAAMNNPMVQKMYENAFRWLGREQ
jgi:type 1 glutamine amidotransferase